MGPNESRSSSAQKEAYASGKYKSTTRIKGPQDQKLI